ncbi:MAG: helix-turn-helix domain-containing protein [Candidatus Bilamarchaeaceae archaeon]
MAIKKMVTNEELLAKIEEINNKLQMLDEPMRPESAAAFLGLSIGTIYNMVSTGELPHYKKGKLIFFYKRELINWIKQGGATC